MMNKFSAHLQTLSEEEYYSNMFPQDEELNKEYEQAERDKEQIERANIELSDWNLAPLLKRLFRGKNGR